MSCREYQERLLEAVRGRPSRDEALAHARQCAECDSFLESQRALTAGLSALARIETHWPSVALEASLLRKVKRVREWRWRLARAIGVAAAAACALILLLPRSSFREHVVRDPAAPRNLTAAAPAQPGETPPAEKSPVHTAANKKWRARRPEQASSLVSATPAGDVAAEFVGIPYSAPLNPNERAELVRVNMPATALAAWGLAVPGMDPGLRINADLVIGEDGLARAIRLIR